MSTQPTANQTVARHVNDVVASSFGPAESMEVLCECGRQGCSRLLFVRRDEYDAIKRDARFIVAADHDFADAEPQHAYAVVDAPPG